MSPWVSISLVWTGRSYQRINSILTLRSLITAKSTREKQTQRKQKTENKTKTTSHFKYNCFSQLISSCVAADNSTSFCLEQWMTRFDVNTVIKNAKKKQQQPNISSLTFSAMEVWLIPSSTKSFSWPAKEHQTAWPPLFPLWNCVHFIRLSVSPIPWIISPGRCFFFWHAASLPVLRAM